MMDDYRKSGRFKRVQVVRQDVREDAQQPVQQDARQLARVPSFNIDEVAGNWAREIREAGMGMTLGPKDGVVAIPDSSLGSGAEEKPGGFVKELIGQDKPLEEQEVAEAVENVERAVRGFVQGIRDVLRRDHD